MSDLADKLPENAFLKFRDEKVEPNLRRAAERAVAALVSRSAAAVAQRRAAEAELTKLTDAIEAPITKLIHNDPEAVRALEVVRKRPLLEPADIAKLAPNAFRVPRNDLASTRDLPGNVPLPDGVQILVTAKPPFRFTWWWWEGNEPHAMVQEHGGYFGMDARSGVGGASGYVSCHAGVGTDLQPYGAAYTVHACSVIDRARYVAQAQSLGFGGNATAEVGVELVVIDDTGATVEYRPYRWGRLRVSGFETGHDQQGTFPIGVPPDFPEWVTWTAQPGRAYMVNIGMWAFTDRSTGVGGASAQALIEGVVNNIWLACAY